MRLRCVGRQSLAVACAAALAATTIVHAQSSQKVLVSTDLITEYKGALLAKNGVQTTCEVALISMSAGFVAAACLDYTSGTTLNAAVSLEVWLDNRSTDSAVTKYGLRPADVHIHPDYNPNTFANNIAVIQFNKNTTDSYYSLIQTDYNSEAQQIYVQRGVDRKRGTWNAPATANQVHDSLGCTDASRLYQSNKRQFSCSGVVGRSALNPKCHTSYGSMYVGVDATLILAGIHSSTVVYGNTTCGDSLGWISYYTLLGPYAGFAVSALKRGINIYQGGKPTITTDSALKIMVDVAESAPNLTTTWSGNFYAYQGALGPNMPSSSDVESERNSGSESESEPGRSSKVESDSGSSGTNVDDSGGSATDSGGSSGMSKSAKIIIGVLVPMGVIIVSIVVAITYHTYRTKRQNKAWDPRAQTADLQNAAWGLGSGNHVDLPSYSDLLAAGHNEQAAKRTGAM